MDKETANLTLQFLARVDLKGAETPAFVKVFNALKTIADQPDPAESPPSKKK